MNNNLLENRYDIVMYFDVTNGNPNGNPNSGNMPRVDDETGHGIITDVCIKRKIRNYVQITREGQIGHDIYITNGAVLNELNRRPYKEYKITPKSKKMPTDKVLAEKITNYMTENFFDVRTFGAVMSTEVNAGIVCGPVQLNFPTSVDPIDTQQIPIARIAVTNEKDAEKEHTFGEKWIVPYGLYRMEGYVTAAFAKKYGFTEDDLELLWEALINMFELDHSAARGKMNPRKLIVFKHKSMYGNSPAQKLFDTVTATKINPAVPPRKYEDYKIEINRDMIPDNIEAIVKYE